MIRPLALLLVLAAGDPRPFLVQLQLEDHRSEALARADRELAEQPALAHQIGLDYLRGALLDRLGKHQEAITAFVAAMGETPALLSYSRYRLALDQERAGHPEG